MPEAHHIPLPDRHLKHSLRSTPGASLEGYKAPLIARVHLRLGMWLWTLHPVEVGPIRPLKCALVSQCMWNIILIVSNILIAH